MMVVTKKIPHKPSGVLVLTSITDAAANTAIRLNICAFPTKIRQPAYPTCREQSSCTGQKVHIRHLLHC